MIKFPSFCEHFPHFLFSGVTNIFEASLYVSFMNPCAIKALCASLSLIKRLVRQITCKFFVELKGVKQIGNYVFFFWFPSELIGDRSNRKDYILMKLNLISTHHEGLPEEWSTHPPHKPLLMIFGMRKVLFWIIFCFSDLFSTSHFKRSASPWVKWWRPYQQKCCGWELQGKQAEGDLKIWHVRRIWTRTSSCQKQNKSKS